MLHACAGGCCSPAHPVDLGWLFTEYSGMGGPEHAWQDVVHEGQVLFGEIFANTGMLRVYSLQFDNLQLTRTSY